MASVGGDIELMPVTDVALWVAGRSFTGTLSIRRRTVESRFTLRSGCCVQAASNDPREYLGQHLINFGHIDEEQLQRAFDTQKETKVPLGRVLVMVDAISSAQLQTVLHFKTREGLLESLGWGEGTWKLAPEIEGDADLDCERPISLREAVSEAAARQAMWTEVRRVFPSDGTRCDVLAEPNSVESGFDRRLMQLMRAGHTVGEAALELRAMDFQVYARLYDLASRQLVRPLLTSTIQVSSLRPPPTTPPPAATPAPAPAPEMSTALPPLFPSPSGRFPGAPVMGASADGPAFSSSFVVARAPAPAEEELLDVNIEEDDAPPAPTSVASPPAPTPSPASPTPGSSWKAPPAPAPEEEDAGFGTYMMVRPERASDPPGAKIPPEAKDPAQALRLALAGRNWSEALLLSQRILEADPLDSEAIAAFRVAEAQLRRIEKQGGGASDAEFDQVPRLAVARETIAQSHLTSKERYVLSRVDGTRSLRQIAAVSPIQRAELLRIVENFVKQGVLRY
jgi:hypothetical protein